MDCERRELKWDVHDGLESEGGKIVDERGRKGRVERGMGMGWYHEDINDEMKEMKQKWNVRTS